jgi:hypothetical protein
VNVKHIKYILVLGNKEVSSDRFLDSVDAANHRKDSMISYHDTISTER